MDYSHIPGTDLNPAPICLGTSLFGATIDRTGAFELLDVYLARGGNFVDTASVYADWLPVERSISEKTIGQWLQLRKNRSRVILATKGAHPELSTMHISRLSRAEIEWDLNASLKNLQTDTIDLYWLHRDEPARPVEEILTSLHDQVRAGKIRYFGCSNWSLARIQAAQAYAARQGWQGFVANQMMWSLAVTDPAANPDPTIIIMDAAMWAYHQETALTAIPYSSQAKGLFQKLARSNLNARDVGLPALYRVEENERRFERTSQLAAESGRSISQIVLAYLLSQPFPTIPIVGCRTVEHLGDSLTAAAVRLSPEQLEYLERGF